MRTCSLRKLVSTTSLLALGASALGAAAFIAPTSAQAAEDDDVIVVTARRREESLQDTPVAVSAFDANTLERRQIEATVDLDKITPSLQFTSYGQLSGNNSAAVVFIRGVGQIDPTPAVDPGVGIYIDEVYMGRAVGGALDFGDIENVQVLRGPQGTLFGRNTIGGAVLVTSRDPADVFGGSARVKVGEDNLVELFGSLDIPIADGLAARVSAGGRQRDGYVVRSFDGQDLGDENMYTLQGVVQWDASPDFELTVRGDYTNEDENGSPFVFAEINENAPVPAIVSVVAGCPGATIPFGPFAPGDPEFGAPNVPLIDDARCANDFYEMGEFVNGGSADVYSTFEGGGVSATAEWDVSDAVALKSITAFRSIEWTGSRDADNTPFTILTTQYASESDQFSQELQATFELDQLHGVAGLYYFDEETDDDVNVPLSFPPAPPLIARMLGGGVGSRDRQFVNLTTESTALFTEWTYDFNDALSLSGGLRYTDETKGMQGTIFNIFDASDPDPSPLPTLATSEGGSLFIFNRPFEESFNALTGSARAQYRWSDTLMTYVSFTQGFKSGGFNQRYNTPTADDPTTAANETNLPRTFDEETVDTWELGFKSDLTDDLRLNGAVFMSDYQDMQLIFREGVIPLLFNAGDASIDGAELEFAYSPASGLIIDGGVSYLDAQFDRISTFSNPALTATVTLDSELPYTPNWQANIGGAYTFATGTRFDVTPRINVSYTDDFFFDVGNTASVSHPASTVVDGAVALEDEAGGWTLTLSVDNLTDELYPLQGNSSLGTLGYAEIIYARPRTWAVEVSKTF
ncbi:MAG: TonB-dependent receptor [Maricaulaceae bacterium]|jgi:iron complex outermembrane receptor protein